MNQTTPFGARRATAVNRFAVIGAVALGLSVAVLAEPQAQRGGRGAAPGQGQRGRGDGPIPTPNDIPIVEIVGCLSEQPNNVWVVTNATAPVQASAGFSRPDDVKAAEGRALGTQQFRLIGLGEFTPAEHKNHKVLVKGLHIKDSAAERVNVSSLTTVKAVCDK